jgi:hypothetical protein
MEQIFTLIQNTQLGIGSCSPNKLLIREVGTPYMVEDVKKVMTYFKVYYEGITGEGDNETSEYISWREGNQEVESQVLFYLLDVDANKTIINQILSQFKFKGFLTNLTLSI